MQDQGWGCASPASQLLLPIILKFFIQSYVRLLRDIHGENKEPRAPEFILNFDAHLVRALSKDQEVANSLVSFYIEKRRS